MPVPRARQIALAASERRRLKRLAHYRTAPFQQVVRARLVLDAAHGYSNARIAVRRHVHLDTVRTWRGRYADQGLEGLKDRPRPGRPPRLTPLQQATVKALACQLPAETGVPLARWSSSDLATEAITRGHRPGDLGLERPTDPGRRHSQAVAAPVFIRDPDFQTKAARILDLYQRAWNGRPLGDEEYVISSDEKTSIQARCRCHPTLPPGAARMMRLNHEYDRGGSLAYLAAYDVHRATVFGHCAAKTGIVPFMTLVEKVMTSEPYTSAKRVYWVVDNGSSHRGKAAVDRLARDFPNAVMVHTPVHASWLNQVEIFFSIVQRKVVTPNDFTSLDQVEDRLTTFERRYNETARPFKWKFTPADLKDLLARIERHEQKEHHSQQPTGYDHQPAALQPAA
ncbi:IS630 family transposase [Actinoallomurus sp. CA-150999]|uniref:IS630 family transposase n=1 Tax=Actinoallomurus sp. CA-150999 TaxID=3239887 RepID=UPI003D91976D